MDEKQKAGQLIHRFSAHAIGDTGEQNWINAKNCALVSVKDTIIALHVGSDMQNFYIEVQKELEKP